MTDFNALVEAEVERHARQWEKTEERLCKENERLFDRVRELELRAASVEGDVPWFIKDFNVLYRAAKRLAEACHGKGEDNGKPYVPLKALDAQLERLAPAFGVTEEIRKAPR
jgi:hypothetical protein